MPYQCSTDIEDRFCEPIYVYLGIFILVGCAPPTTCHFSGTNCPCHKVLKPARVSALRKAADKGIPTQGCQRCVRQLTKAFPPELRVSALRKAADKGIPTQGCQRCVRQLTKAFPPELYVTHNVCLVLELMHFIVHFNEESKVSIRWWLNWPFRAEMKRKWGSLL